MNKIHLGEVESKFADIIWENEPLATSELTKLCEEKLNWKRTTTYTVLKRLGKRGLFCNNGGIVTSLISRGEFNSLKCLLMSLLMDHCLHFLRHFHQAENLLMRMYQK